MRTISEIETWLEASIEETDYLAHAADLLGAGEEILENWLVAHDKVPVSAEHEGFRLLALHRQASRGDPSFNACRETCREIAYHYNLATAADVDRDLAWTVKMMRMVTKHLALFIGGKLQESGLGDFCCSSKALRSKDHALAKVVGE